MFGKTHRERRTPTVSMHLMSRPGHMETGPCLKNTPRAKNAHGLNAFNVKARAHGGWPMFGRKTHRERRTHTVSTHLMSRPGHMEAGPCLKNTHRDRRTHAAATHFMSRPGHMEAGPCLKNTPLAKNANGLNAFNVKAGARGGWPMFGKNTLCARNPRGRNTLNIKAGAHGKLSLCCEVCACCLRQTAAAPACVGVHACTRVGACPRQWLFVRTTAEGGRGVAGPSLPICSHVAGSAV